MYIAIQNKALKSFVGRLQALKGTYPIEVLTMTALDGTELFHLDVDIDEEQLASFAQDAKFGFSQDFTIERVLHDVKYDYQTQHYIELNTGENAEQELLELRKRFSDASVSYRALEYSCSENHNNVIRAYVSNNQEQEELAKLVG